MTGEKETTVLNTSVGADAGQPNQNLCDDRVISEQTPKSLENTDFFEYYSPNSTPILHQSLHHLRLILKPNKK